jgi:hypothetical protein
MTSVSVSISVDEPYRDIGWEWYLRTDEYVVSRCPQRLYTSKANARRAAKCAAKELGFALRGEPTTTTKEPTP